MKENRKYYFTVEGETEKWYLQWLQDTVNGIKRYRFTKNRHFRQLYFML